MVKTKKEVDMLSGSITKGLLKITLPIMTMNVIICLFNIIDMTVLKMYDTDGGFSVGSVGACGTLISLITGLMIGISSGANAVIARHIGSGDRDRVKKSIGTSLMVAVLGGLVLTVIGVSFAEIFLVWMNCPELLLDGAVLYFRLYFIGGPIMMLSTFTSAILSSSGDTRRPMVYSIIGGAAKVGLNLAFVGLFKMGITGVALSTIISWTLTSALTGFAIFKSGGTVKVTIKDLRISKQELSEILFIGVPTGLQQALYSIANVIITAAVNSFGPEATTGISIANQFDGILYQISMATSIAVMPYVSQNIGNRNIKRATQSVLKGTLITIAFGAFFGALSAIFSAELSSIMSDNPEVIAYSQQKMIIISSTYFICGLNGILISAMNGMKKPIVATVTTFLYMCVIRFIWVYGVFPLYRNLTFLYLIWPIGWILSIITILCFYFPAVKHYKREFAKDNEPSRAEAVEV